MFTTDVRLLAHSLMIYSRDFDIDAWHAMCNARGEQEGILTHTQQRPHDNQTKQHTKPSALAPRYS